MEPPKILYEDRYLLLCEKPVGVSSQKGDGRLADMPMMLSNYRLSKGESGYIGVVHRLDTPTGGVMLYAKQESMTAALSAALSSSDYQKTYLAVVHGVPAEESGELRDLLFHDKQKNKSYTVKKKRQGVKEALAHYRLRGIAQTETGDSLSLLEVTLVTGRTHQIRVQLASRKLPLVGDGKYGSLDNKTTCALWSHRVCFTHPKNGERIEVESHPPHRYPWSLFEK